MKTSNNQCCPEGGVAPLENFVWKNIKGGTKGKIDRSLPTPLRKFRREKISKVKFNPPPSNFGNFQS
jgi:hypothetical protein